MLLEKKRGGGFEKRLTILGLEKFGMQPNC